MNSSILKHLGRFGKRQCTFAAKEPLTYELHAQQGGASYSVTNTVQQYFSIKQEICS